MQNPNDVWIIQEIIAEVKPDFVIETGTFRGGSAALWAMILDQVNPEGRVITVDLHERRAENLPPIALQKVEFLIGSSTDPVEVSVVVSSTSKKRSESRLMVPSSRRDARSWRRAALARPR